MLFPIIVIFLLVSNAVMARTWKSADNTKTFDADFLKLSGDSMKCVTKTGKEITVSLSKLSMEDQAWAKTAAEVVSRSKLETGYRVVLIAKERDVVVRLALDAKMMIKGQDPYSGEFILLDRESPGVQGLGVKETRVDNLYWAGSKKITVDKSSLTSNSYGLWMQWSYDSGPGSRHAVLQVYHTSLESAVDSILTRKSAESVHE